MKTLTHILIACLPFSFLWEPIYAQDQIQHVVIIVKQNKSFDHYFGTFPNADGATSGRLSTGQVVSLVHSSDVLPAFCNSPYCYAGGANGGQMDRFDIMPYANQDGNLAAYSQMTEADIPNYFAYARRFVLADRMFSPQQAAGFPNQLLYIAATNGGAFENPYTPKNLPSVWGCDADPSTYLKDWDAQGNISLKFPCFDFPTITDSIENSPAGLTWRFYGPQLLGKGYEWNPLDAINHIRNTSRWNQVVSNTQFVRDALNGDLPTVSWIVPSSHDSEHAGALPWGASACDGENWTVEQINAVMKGPLWNSTAIFLMWDDSGGFFDHVPPPSIGPYALGVRVPLLIISPYAKAGYVSHTQLSHYSTLKFVETIFNLPALTKLDGNSATMLDSFDFTQSPQSPLVLQQRVCPIIGTNAVGFGGQLVGVGKGPSPVRITNRRSTPLTIKSVKTIGNFAQTNNCSTLQPLQSCVINLEFTPVSLGATSGQLIVADNDSTSPQTVALTGTGSALQVSAASLPTAYVGIGMKSPAQIVTVTNNGSDSVDLASIQTIGDFSETNTCGVSLSPAHSCTITVAFSPMHAGLLYGAIFIHSSDPASPHRVLLSGWGYQSNFRPSALTFVARKVGTSSPPQTIEVRNLGATRLTFASFSVSGDFAQTNTCGTSIAAAGKCVISVTFNPTAIGTRAGQITVTDSDLRNPQVLKLTGTGQ